FSSFFIFFHLFSSFFIFFHLFSSFFIFFHLFSSPLLAIHNRRSTGSSRPGPHKQEQAAAPCDSG
ncbi:MAG: hypothetical protein J6J97_08585, partial [Akkermansia sp.]|nr:hypothetical protein [Akkermansia sp.]